MTDNEYKTMKTTLTEWNRKLYDSISDHYAVSNKWRDATYRKVTIEKMTEEIKIQHALNKLLMLVLNQLGE